MHEYHACFITQNIMNHYALFVDNNCWVTNQYLYLKIIELYVLYMKTCLLTNASSDSFDQPAHPRCVVRTFAGQHRTSVDAG